MLGCRLHLHCFARVKQCLNHGVGQWFICIGTLAKWKFSIFHPQQPLSHFLSLSLAFVPPVWRQHTAEKSNEHPQWNLLPQRHCVQGQRWVDRGRLHRVHLSGKPHYPLPECNPFKQPGVSWGKTFLCFLYPCCNEVIIVFMLAPPFIITLLLYEIHQHFFLTINKAACFLQQLLLKVVQVLCN